MDEIKRLDQGLHNTQPIFFYYVSSIGSDSQLTSGISESYTSSQRWEWNMASTIQLCWQLTCRGVDKIKTMTWRFSTCAPLTNSRVKLCSVHGVLQVSLLICLFHSRSSWHVGETTTQSSDSHCTSLYFSKWNTFAIIEEIQTSTNMLCDVWMYIFLLLPLPSDSLRREIIQLCSFFDFLM